MWRVPVVILAVALGGALGSVARAAIDVALPHDQLPWGTLLVNTVGAFCIGLLGGGLQRSWPKWLQQGATTGFLGGFTTYSALALWLTIDDLDHWSLIIGTAAAVVGVMTAFAGLLLGEKLSGRHGPAESDPSGNGDGSGGWLSETGNGAARESPQDATSGEPAGQTHSNEEAEQEHKPEAEKTSERNPVRLLQKVRRRSRSRAAPTQQPADPAEAATPADDTAGSRRRLFRLPKRHESDGSAGKTPDNGGEATP